MTDDPALPLWFLGASERGNAATRLDATRAGDVGWSTGNVVTPLVHGAAYFARLRDAVGSLRAGDELHFADWRGDADERLDDTGTTLGDLLADAAARGVAVRGLVWRSHPDETKFSERENLRLARAVNEAGGEVVADERVRRGGCHHQKIVVLRRAGDGGRDDVAFVGGIDLCHGRRDDDGHTGDGQPIALDSRYGRTPPWHDVQLEVRGPAVADVDASFAERWNDPTPVDHRNPWRRLMARRALEPTARDPVVAAAPPEARGGGTQAVQVLRTYGAKEPPYPFAPSGERSIARAYAKALARARALVYVEDQYLWSEDVARLLANALRRSPRLRLIAVVPRYPDRNGRFSGPPNRIGQEAAIEVVRRAGGDRVQVLDLENDVGTPIYVHAKVCVIDDVWAAVGSDNLNRRSWTHDSELSCAVIDEARDQGSPADPGGLGDGARRFARELRVRLWREHLGGDVGEDVLIDPERGFDAWRECATRLDDWHRAGRRGPRPPGRVRPHDPGRVDVWNRWWARPLYRLVIDPDGRPRELRQRGEF